METQRTSLKNVALFSSFLLFFGITIAFQYYRNAYSVELKSDAAGHFITTLLAYDYLKNGFPSNPVAYATDYFIHYPLIRIGNNPPVFYGLSGTWAFIAGPTVQAALLLSALLGAIFCFVQLLWLSRLWNLHTAIILAAMTALLPTYQRVSASFLIDIPIGIFSLAAAMSYAAFLQKKTRTGAVWFSIFAAIAILIKLSALFLAIMVPLAVIISGKYSLVRNRYFWLPALIVGSLAAPWYLYTFETLTAGAKTQWTITYPLQALAGYSAIIADNLSLPGTALLIAGIADRFLFIRTHPDSEASDHWTAIIALFFCVLIFQILMPTNILDRYLISVLAPAIMLMLAGAQMAGGYAAKFLERYPAYPESLRKRTPEIILAAMACLIFINALQLNPEASNQMDQAAKAAYDNLPAGNPTVLIASDGNREVSFIAHMAQWDLTRPSVINIRGARLLGKEGGFMNIDYEPKFSTPEEILSELEKLSIAMIVLDTSKASQSWKHNRDIAWLVENKPEIWRKTWSQDNPGGDGAVTLYMLKSSATKTMDIKLLRQALRPRSGGFGVAK